MYYNIIETTPNGQATVVKHGFRHLYDAAICGGNARAGHKSGWKGRKK